MESQGSSVGNRNGAKYWTTDVGVLKISLFAALSRSALESIQPGVFSPGTKRLMCKADYPSSTKNGGYE